MKSAFTAIILATRASSNAEWMAVRLIPSERAKQGTLSPFSCRERISSFRDGAPIEGPEIGLAAFLAVSNSRDGDRKSSMLTDWLARIMVFPLFGLLLLINREGTLLLQAGCRGLVSFTQSGLDGS
jgi:hypothetical protein